MLTTSTETAILNATLAASGGHRPGPQWFSDPFASHPQDRPPMEARAVYQGLTSEGLAPRYLDDAQRFLTEQLANTRQLPSDLPEDAAELDTWLRKDQQRTLERYETYLACRKAGAPRHFFSSRSHAFYFLRCMAPSRLVQSSAWRYRALLASNGLEEWHDVPNAFYIQGAIQLALGLHAETHVPEVVGYNIGNDQLSLQALIAGHELAELNIIDTGFDLHAQLNAAGHARRAALAMLDDESSTQAVWDGVRRGYLLNQLGMTIESVARSFDARAEVVALLQRHGTEPFAGNAQGVAAVVAGRPLVEWLSDEVEVPYLLDALEAEQRCGHFWQLLYEGAGRFFSRYELELIHNWMCEAAGVDLPLDARPAFA